MSEREVLVVTGTGGVASARTLATRSGSDAVSASSSPSNGAAAEQYAARCLARGRSLARRPTPRSTALSGTRASMHVCMLACVARGYAALKSAVTPARQVR